MVSWPRVLIGSIHLHVEQWNKNGRCGVTESVEGASVPEEIDYSHIQYLFYDRGMVEVIATEIARAEGDLI